MKTYLAKPTHCREDRSVDVSAEAVRVGLKSAIEARARAMWEDDAGPPPELLALVRRSAELAAGPPHRRAQFLLAAGLLHDLARDVDGAERYYAEARDVNEHVGRHGNLARVRKLLIDRRAK